jgi:hypothetical protein
MRDIRSLIYGVVYFEYDSGSLTTTEERSMFRIKVSSLTGLTLAALAVLAAVFMSAGLANAVVYCKTVGVPRGCVVRPVARPVVVAPAGGAVVYCKTRGVPKGCVMR